MWKDYSAGYLRHNRASGVSVMVSVFISALLLSLLCGVFYNLWKYEVERIELEEGGWHSRITGEIDRKDLETIQDFAHVSRAKINEKATTAQETTVDLYFDDKRAALENTPKIAENLGIPSEGISYHYGLLAMYLIRVPQDPSPRLIFPLFLLIVGLASFSLIVIIHNSFAVSMNSRIHQFGILSSIGATPRQIRTCLLQEATALCAGPAALGNVLGILGCMWFLQMTNHLPGTDIPGRHEAVFGYHPLVLVFTLLTTTLTVWISAWIPARRLSRLTPLQAIRTPDELQLRRQKRSRVLPRIFGIEGELAANALKAQRRALRTASFAFLFSFLAFTMMQCFFTLSDISTRETYFERNLDVWDVMTTVKDTQIDSFGDAAAIREMPDVRNVAVYQKARAGRIITEEEISGEMRAFGGFNTASPDYVTKTKAGWLVNVPIVILDDDSFIAYCRQIGAAPQSIESGKTREQVSEDPAAGGSLPRAYYGAVVLNRIRDVTNPDFRHPRLCRYIKEEEKTTILQRVGNEEVTAEIPVLSYTDEVPLLREEYATIDYYELVHFLPVSLWKEIKEQIGGAEEDTYVRVLGKEGATLEELNRLQSEIDRRLNDRYTVESENRIQEKENNDRQIGGMKAILSSFCALLAVIGVGNVFSNALGFVRQRKREIARYMSVGLTPVQIRKIFCIEAFIIAIRPVLFTFPVLVLSVWGMLWISYMEWSVFLAEAPYIPVFIFMVLILGAVALAYFLGWRNVKKIRLTEALRDDTMM